MKTLILCLFSIGGLLAQSTPPNQLQIYSPAPSPVRQIGGGTVGQSGSTTLYYWVIARYSSGIAVNTTPVAIFNTVGTANLSASNYVSVTWGAVGGATGYDVLRSTTPIYPANPTCTACAVTLNTPNSSVADTGAALSDYPPGGLVQSSSTTATIYIDNSNSVPYLNTQLLYRATENLIVGLISGSIANGDCLEYSNGRIVSAGAACGSGSGGASLPYPGIAVGLTSSTSIARSLVGSDSSISIANPDGTTGNPDLSVNTGIISSREQVQLGSSIYALTTGTSTAYLCGLTPAATVGFLANGTSVRLKIDETSGAAPVTLSCDGSTAKTIYKRNGTTAAAQVTTGELITNQIYNFDYDSSLNAGAGGWLTDVGGGSSSGTPTNTPYYPWGGVDINSVIGASTALNVRFYEFDIFSPGKTITSLSVATGSTGGIFAFALYSADCTTLLAQTNTVNVGTFDDDQIFVFTSPQTLTAGKYVLGIAEQAGTGLLRRTYGYYLPVGGRDSTNFPYFRVTGVDATYLAPDLTMPSACTGTRVSLNASAPYALAPYIAFF